MSHIKDEELVAMHLSGDLEAFESLVERYADSMFRLAYKFCGNTHDAEDIAQNTFIKVYEYLPKSKTDLPFKPWIFQICVNLCRNFAKKKKSLIFSDLEKHSEEDVLPYDAPDKADTPDTQARKKDQAEQVQKAISELKEKFQVVITLYYFEELQYEEIAEVLGIPINTVRTHLKRAKSYLEKKLGHLI